MSQGQLTVRQEREVIRGRMISDIEDQKAEIMKFLTAFDVDFDFFLAGLKVALMRVAEPKPVGDPEFFDKVTTASFLEAVLNCAKNGLVPDGKEAAIGRFADRATFMPMRGGFVKSLWRTGLIKSINDNIVTVAEYEQGRFEYEEGDQGFIRHRPDLMRKDTDPTAAAYCVIELVNGGVMREVVLKDDLEKIAKMSKSPARGTFRFQMDRKAAIRRIMGKMPQERAMAQLLAHDDLNYDTKLLDAPAETAIPAKRLFSNRAAKKAAPLPPPEILLKATEEARPDDADPGEEAVDTNSIDLPPDLSAIMEMLGAAETIARVAVIETEAEAAPWFADLTADQKGVFFDAIARRRRDLSQDRQDGRQGGGVASADRKEPSAEPFVLRAVLTARNGVQEFDEVGFWRGDIESRVKLLPAEHHEKFWELNGPHILAAEPHYPDDVAKLRAFAYERGGRKYV